MHGARRRTAWLLATLAVLTTGGCGAERVDALEALAAARGGADAVHAPRTLAESLPNQHFLLPSGELVPGSESVVLGRVTEVGLGTLTVGGGDATVTVGTGSTGTTGSTGSTGSADALWHVATVTLGVDRAWGELAGVARTTVDIPLHGPGTAEQQVAALRGLGRVLVLVTDGRIERDTGLIALVADDGSLTFPALRDEGPAFVGTMDTVAEVTAAMTQVRDIIALDGSGARQPPAVVTAGG